MTWLESGSLCCPGPWTGRRRSALFFLDRGSERKYFPLRLAGFFPYSKLTRTFFFACTDSLFRAHRCLPSFDGFLGSALCSPGLPPLLRLLPGLRRRQEAATSLLPPNWQSEPSPPAGAPKVPLGSSRSRWERLRPGKALVAADFLFPGRAAMHALERLSGERVALKPPFCGSRAGSQDRCRTSGDPGRHPSWIAAALPQSESSPSCLASPQKCVPSRLPYAGRGADRTIPQAAGGGR